MNLLDLIIVATLFAIVAAIGYFSSRKIGSTEDFLVAGRQLNRLQASFSLAASEFGGGGMVGGIGLCYLIGLSGVWWNWVAVIPFILVGLFLAPRLRRLNIVTVPEYLAQRYGSNMRVLAAGLHIAADTAGLAAQFMVAAAALTALTGISMHVALILAVVFVALYTMGGGYLAVVNTDVFQFGIILISLLISVAVALVNVGGVSSLFAELPAAYARIGELGFAEPFSWFLLCLFDYATAQYVVSRVFAAKDPGVARFSFLFTGIFYLFAGLLIAVLGVALARLLPGLPQADLAFTQFIDLYLPAGIRGLALGGLFMAAVSTSDSSLIGITALLVTDFYKPYVDKAEQEEVPVFVCRVVMLLSCVVGVFISFQMNSIIEIIYLSGLLYGAGVFFPLVCGVFLPRIKARAGFWSLVAAVSSGLFSQFFLYGKVTGFWGMVPANMVAACVGLILLLGLSVKE